MVKHRKHKSCTSSAHIKGNHVTVKATCPMKAGKVVRTVTKKSKTHKVTEVPPPCKGLKKKARKACAKKVCAQRPKEYRKDCLRKAGLR